ncbi:DUF6011 domain-containing protein [Streptomyces sp. NPDC020298]|uniref:DUF6011 domain-containing protein n=1 Tax=unclassified Streptomyces TaxID=2593676 RepID=UPI0033C0F22B
MEARRDEEEPVICVCGRTLRDPESIARRTGPVCWRKLHGRPPHAWRQPTPPRPATSTEPMPGQDELPLDDQMALWSV